MSKSETDDGLRYQWRRSGVSLSIDAVAVVGFLVVANGVLFSPFVDSVAVRALVGLPLLFFVPGYALVTALFPGCESSGTSRINWRVIRESAGTTLRDRGVDWRERLALSFGASIALLPLLALALTTLGFSYDLEILAPTVSGVAVFGMVVGVVRRNRLPPRQRFQVPVERWVARLDDGVFGQPSTVDAAINVVVAVVVLASVAGVGYAVVTPNNAESYTSVSILTEGDDGELTLGGYPDSLDQSGEEFVVHLESREEASTTYTVVGELQHVSRSDGSVTPLRRGEVYSTSVTLGASDSWSDSHTVEPVVGGGDDLRLIYYVYEGDAPADPSTETAYRHASVTIDAAVQDSN